ncbi:MAG: hypothetical protein ACWGSQ_13660 [Longimicrobiales bacterium]
MFMVREVLTCRPGKVGEMVKKFQALGEVMKAKGVAPFRIYTDVAAEQFWTLVLESDYETMDDIHATEARVLGDERAKSAMAGYHDLVIKGRREIYKVEG